MSDSAPKSKKLKIEGFREYNFMTNNSINKRMANSFAEFLADPINILPRPEYLDCYIEDDTALVSAIRAQNRFAVAALLNAGCNPNQHNRKGVMPISAAAHKGDTHIMELLISKGAIVDALNVSGSTALIQAAHFGHLHAVILLLRCGADADRANAKGTTALMRAAQEGHEEITKVLIQAKANVNRKNHEGMNALMLASQRGHAGVVMELIKNGAVTDEQTSQGSTALMLSCKRGHERVVNVLVSMGAEICMKDCRNRTAKDTAERRHHLTLLQYLDTQFQVKCVQENVRQERAALLGMMRKTALAGTLQYSRDTAILNSLVNMFKRIQSSSRGGFRPEDVFSVASEWTESQPLGKHANPETSGPVEKIINGGGILNLCRNISTALSFSYSPPTLPEGLIARISGNADWNWPFLLMRCFSLPLGIYEMIVDYLPSPRVWKWSLNHLKKRATLCPHVAVVDLSILIDEILTDLKLLHSPIQRGHLLRINENQQIRGSLIRDLHIPEVLVESLVRWSDVQSLSYRTTELDVTFKSTLAKRYLVLAITLFRVFRLVHDPARLFTLPTMLMHPPNHMILSRRDSRQDTQSNNLIRLSTSPAAVELLTAQNTHIPISTGMIDELLMNEVALHQMLYHDGSIQQNNMDTLDDEDSLNEFGALTNDHDTETELPGDGGNFAASDDDDDDNE